MIKQTLHEDAGHPWTQLPGWDGLTVDADTDNELKEAIQKAESEFWCVWISGYRGPREEPQNCVRSAYLYRPVNQITEWTKEQKNHGLCNPEI